jgi:ADP-ribose pyrophosphatase YjhB (NUDIX family)
MARRSTPRHSGQRSRERSGGRGRRAAKVEEVSAGGLVVSGEGTTARAALIGKLDRRGRLVWSLPKGHVEDGETLEQTATREVAEETGISGEVLVPLGTVDYWFFADGRRIHKTVHHYLLRAVSGELSKEDVEVTDVAWVPLSELGDRLVYPDERRLVEVVPRLLERSA